MTSPFNAHLPQLPFSKTSSSRTYLLEGFATIITKGHRKQRRYLLLFEDWLIIVKSKPNNAFQLKQKIRVAEIWLTEQITGFGIFSSDVESCSFGIGWPLVNFLITFDSIEIRNAWWCHLINAIRVQVAHEQPDTTPMKVFNWNIQNPVKAKTINITPDQTAAECLTKTLALFNLKPKIDMEDGINHHDGGNVQLCVSVPKNITYDNKGSNNINAHSQQNHTQAVEGAFKKGQIISIPLYGHERPYAIIVNLLMRNEYTVSNSFNKQNSSTSINLKGTQKPIINNNHNNNGLNSLNFISHSTLQASSSSNNATNLNFFGAPFLPTFNNSNISTTSHHYYESIYGTFPNIQNHEHDTKTVPDSDTTTNPKRTKTASSETEWNNVQLQQMLEGNLTTSLCQFSIRIILPDRANHRGHNNLSLTKSLNQTYNNNIPTERKRLSQKIKQTKLIIPKHKNGIYNLRRSSYNKLSELNFPSTDNVTGSEITSINNPRVNGIQNATVIDGVSVSTPISSPLKSKKSFSFQSQHKITDVGKNSLKRVNDDGIHPQSPKNPHKKSSASLHSFGLGFVQSQNQQQQHKKMLKKGAGGIRRAHSKMDCYSVLTATTNQKQQKNHLLSIQGNYCCTTNSTTMPLTSTTSMSLSNKHSLVEDDLDFQCTPINIKKIHSNEHSPARTSVSEAIIRTPDMYSLKSDSGGSFFSSIVNNRGARTVSSNCTPSDESLRKYGGEIKSSSILFNKPLDELFLVADNSFPKPIKKMLQLLYTYGPHTIGIFRKSSSFKLCKCIRQQLDQGIEVNLDDVPMLAISSIYKEFLRNIPNGLMDCNLYDKWYAVTSTNQNETEKLKLCKGLFHQLPKHNRLMLGHTLRMFQTIHENCQYNGMNRTNLAICVGPSLLWEPVPTNEQQSIKSNLPLETFGAGLKMPPVSKRKKFSMLNFGATGWVTNNRFSSKNRSKDDNRFGGDANAENAGTVSQLVEAGSVVNLQHGQNNYTVWIPQLIEYLTENINKLDPSSVAGSSSFKIKFNGSTSRVKVHHRRTPLNNNLLTLFDKTPPSGQTAAFPLKKSSSRSLTIRTGILPRRPTKQHNKLSRRLNAVVIYNDIEDVIDDKKFSLTTPPSKRVLPNNLPSLDDGNNNLKNSSQYKLKSLRNGKKAGNGAFLITGSLNSLPISLKEDDHSSAHNNNNNFGLLSSPYSVKSLSSFDLKFSYDDYLLDNLKDQNNCNDDELSFQNQRLSLNYEKNYPLTGVVVSSPDTQEESDEIYQNDQTKNLGDENDFVNFLRYNKPCYEDQGSQPSTSIMSNSNGHINSLLEDSSDSITNDKEAYEITSVESLAVTVRSYSDNNNHHHKRNPFEYLPSSSVIPFIRDDEDDKYEKNIRYYSPPLSRTFEKCKKNMTRINNETSSAAISSVVPKIQPFGGLLQNSFNNNNQRKVVVECQNCASQRRLFYQSLQKTRKPTLSSSTTTPSTTKFKDHRDNKSLEGDMVRGEDFVKFNNNYKRTNKSGGPSAGERSTTKYHSHTISLISPLTSSSRDSGLTLSDSNLYNTEPELDHPHQHPQQQDEYEEDEYDETCHQSMYYDTEKSHVSRLNFTPKNMIPSESPPFTNNSHESQPPPEHQRRAKESEVKVAQVIFDEASSCEDVDDAILNGTLKEDSTATQFQSREKIALTTTAESPVAAVFEQCLNGYKARKIYEKSLRLYLNKTTVYNINEFPKDTEKNNDCAAVISKEKTVSSSTYLKNDENSAKVRELIGISYDSVLEDANDSPYYFGQQNSSDVTWSVSQLTKMFSDLAAKTC